MEPTWIVLHGFLNKNQSFVLIRPWEKNREAAKEKAFLKTLYGNSNFKHVLILMKFGI